MHIQKLTKSAPVAAQIDSTTITDLMTKIQTAAATVISVSDAVSSVSKSAE
jgi:hypothetical protein